MRNALNSFKPSKLDIQNMRADVPSGTDGFRIFNVSENSARLPFPKGREGRRILRVRIILVVRVLAGDLERRCKPGSSSALDKSRLGVPHSVDAEKSRIV